MLLPPDLPVSVGTFMHECICVLAHVYGWVGVCVCVGVCGLARVIGFRTPRHAHLFIFFCV
jgi:hypothetical protein